jgi:hypothetical protein
VHTDFKLSNPFTNPSADNDPNYVSGLGFQVFIDGTDQTSALNSGSAADIAAQQRFLFFGVAFNALGNSNSIVRIRDLRVEIISRKAVIRLHKGGDRAVRPVDGAERLRSSGAGTQASAHTTTPTAS